MKNMKTVYDTYNAQRRKVSDKLTLFDLGAESARATFNFRELP